MSLVRKQKKKVKNAALCCIFQTVDKDLGIPPRIFL